MKKEEDRKHFANGFLTGFGLLAIVFGLVLWYKADDLSTFLINEFQGAKISINGNYVLDQLSLQKDISLFSLAAGVFLFLYGLVREHLLGKRT